MPRTALLSRALPAVLAVMAAPLLAPQLRAAVKDHEEIKADRVSLSDLADDPGDYVGRWISVKGAVEDVYGRGLFSLDKDANRSRGTEILVLNPKPAGQLRADSEVTVVGRVERFDADRFDDEYDGWKRDVDKDLIGRFAARPVLVAQSIQLVENGDNSRSVDLVARSADAPAILVVEPRTIVASRDETPDPVAVSTDDIQDNPERYFGRRVMVRADVDHVRARTVFELDDDVVVVAPGLASSIGDDEEVVVIGTVIPFARETIEGRVRGYTLDLSDDAVDDMDGHPAILATSVQVDGKERLTK